MAMKTIKKLSVGISTVFRIKTNYTTYSTQGIWEVLYQHRNSSLDNDCYVNCAKTVFLDWGLKFCRIQKISAHIENHVCGNWYTKIQLLSYHTTWEILTQVSNQQINKNDC